MRALLIARGFWMVLVGAVVLVGCGGEEEVVVDEHAGKMVYVDTASRKKEAIVMEVADAFPAEHPRTGKRTLMPAMYCPKCGKWHPVPPPDQINRTPKATVCPKTGAAMTFDGPWPEE